MQCSRILPTHPARELQTPASELHAHDRKSAWTARARRRDTILVSAIERYGKHALPAFTASQSETYGSVQKDVPFNTPLVDLVPGCASFSTARCGFGFSGRRRVSNDSVYRIFAIIRSVTRSSRAITHTRT